MKIDYKKIIKEDPEFQVFLKDVWFISSMNDPRAADFFIMVYAMFQAGMSKEQVATFVSVQNGLDDVNRI